MAVAGNIDLWADQFPQDQIRQIFRLILHSWDTFKVPSDRREVPITQKLCAHLRNSRDRSTHFFRVDCEAYVLDDEGELSGRIDLRFSQGLDEHVYFSLECKRLRVRFKSRFGSLANEYVTQGMLRYFTGQYAEGLDKGGMLGYVMDNDVPAAIEDVAKCIEKNRASLCMAPNDTLRASSLSKSQAGESIHKHGPQNRFVIYHLFVPVS
jgi:hypothetical protein